VIFSKFLVRKLGGNWKRKRGGKKFAQISKDQKKKRIGDPMTWRAWIEEYVLQVGWGKGQDSID